MRCEPCKGTGKISRALDPRNGIVCRPIDGVTYPDWALDQMMHERPCEACGGSGVAHCCDGICAQVGD